MSRAADIAAGLTIDQQEAICALTSKFQRAANRIGWRNQAPYEFERINKAAVLVERSFLGGGHGYRLTPLGEEVRRHLQQQERGE